MCYKLKNLFCFMFVLRSMTSKLGRWYKKFLQISHLLLHFSIELFSSFIVLGNNDGDMSPFKFLFCLYVTLTVSSGKTWSILWLLCDTDKCFLMMVLMVGSNGLYRVIKLHLAEKLLLLLGLLDFSLKMLLISENCFLTFTRFTISTY